MDKILLKTANWIRENEKRVIIGISGHGASGKTTFAHNLLSLLGSDNVNYINTDTYIIGSNLRKHTSIEYEYMNKLHQDKMTACHPAAHNRFALERDVQMLREGLDFYTIGTNFTETKFIPSKNSINIVEGMSVAFTNPELYDLKIYIYTDGETELMRRSIRDVSERGTNIQYLMESHNQRRIQYELFMHPYSRHFDIVIKSSNDHCTLEKEYE